MEEISKDNELSLAIGQFFKLMYVDFGIDKLNDKIKKWYELSWEEFRNELENQSVKLNECLIQDWKEFFNYQKSKVLSLMKGSKTLV
jgi:hypothetical protein